MGTKRKAGKKQSTQRSAPKKNRNTLGVDLAEVQEVLGFMKENGLCEFEWESGQQRLSLKTGSASMVAAAPTTVLHAPAPMAAADPAPSNGSGLQKNQEKILSPFVGTFYRAPSPGADPYVKDGQGVKPGDVLCIVEAMKLMNEIEAEMSGKIVSVLVEDGQPVEFGEPLFVIEKS